MSNSDSDSYCIPPDVREGANIARYKVIPEKSKERYESVYKKFRLWCESKKIRTFSDNCFLAYFHTFSMTRKKSLWSNYSMLKACLKFHDQIDISKFHNLIAFLKQETKNNTPKKSRVLDEDHINKFIDEAPDSSFLLMKTVVIMGISGACRREELCNMSINDVEFKQGVIIVTILVTKTNVSRQFVIVKELWITVLQKYLNLRPKTNITRFFLTYHNGKCINSPVGINTFGKIPSKVAAYLKLDNPSEFTGHCFRRTSATLLANHGGDLLAVKQQGGWKSSKVAEGYIENSLQSRINLAQTLTQPGTSSANKQTVTYATSETLNVSTRLTQPNEVVPGVSGILLAISVQ